MKEVMTKEDHFCIADELAVAWAAIRRATERAGYCLPGTSKEMKALYTIMGSLMAARNELDKGWCQTAGRAEYDRLGSIFFRMVNRASDFEIIMLRDWPGVDEDAIPSKSDDAVFLEWRRHRTTTAARAKLDIASAYQDFRTWWANRNAGRPWGMGKFRSTAKRICLVRRATGTRACLLNFELTATAGATPPADHGKHPKRSS